MRNFTVWLDDQRSPEWLRQRVGRLTGSRAKDILDTIKSGESAKRRDYRLQLVCERLTGLPQEDGYINPEMQRGIDLEPRAFAAYEALTGELARRTGFLAHNALMVGCSLDGDVHNFTGILELKCPKSATHLRYLRDGCLPKEHLAQVTHNLWVSGAEWCDFLSFDDRFPPELQTFLARVYRKDVDLNAYEKAALAFLDEVDRDYLAVSTMSNLSQQLKEAIA